MDKILHLIAGFVNDDELKNAEMAEIGDSVSFGNAAELAARTALKLIGVQTANYNLAPWAFESSLGAGQVRCVCGVLFRLSSTEFFFGEDELRAKREYPILILQRAGDRRYDVAGYVLFRELKPLLEYGTGYVRRASGWHFETLHCAPFERLEPILRK